eukprot:gene23546-30531_t
MQDIISDPTGSINRMLATIDVKKSECSVTTDKERIFKIVDREVGFSNINIMIFERMRTWARHYERIDNNHEAGPLYVACKEHLISAFGERHPDTLESCHNLGVFYYNSVHWSAISVLKKCLLEREVVLGVNHPETIETSFFLRKARKNRRSIVFYMLVLAVLALIVRVGVLRTFAFVELSQIASSIPSTVKRSTVHMPLRRMVRPALLLV